MAWAKFKRIDDSNNIDDIDFEDGAFIVTGDGKSYIDYDNDRILISSGIGEALPVGSEVDYDGDDVPTGWEKVDDVPRYSTDEIVCGTWIDGKPIYRKVLTLSSLPNTQTLSIDISSLNVAIVISLVGYSNTGLVFNGTRTGVDSAPIDMFVDISRNQIDLITYQDRSNMSGFIIIEYTKTTD